MYQEWLSFRSNLWKRWIDRFFSLSEENINWEIKSDILCALSKSQSIYLKNDVWAWPIHEVCGMSLVNYWSLKSLLFAYCNVLIISFYLVCGFEFLSWLCWFLWDLLVLAFAVQMAMEIKLAEALFLGKHSLFSISSCDKQVACR